VYRQTVGLSVLTCLSEDDKEVHGDSTKLLHYETVAVKVACRLGYDVLWVCTCVCVCVCVYVCGDISEEPAAFFGNVGTYVRDCTASQ